MSLFDAVFGKGRGGRSETHDRPARELIDRADRAAKTIRVIGSDFHAVSSFQTLIDFHCEGDRELATRIAGLLLDNPKQLVHAGSAGHAYKVIDAAALERQVRLAGREQDAAG